MSDGESIEEILAKRKRWTSEAIEAWIPEAWRKRQRAALGLCKGREYPEHLLSKDGCPMRSPSDQAQLEKATRRALDAKAEWTPSR